MSASASTRPREPGSLRLPSRPMLMAGGTAAIAAAGSGLAVLVVITLAGWITAPHVGVGSGLPGVLRSAGLLWLVAHHVEVTVRGVGRIGLLPLGLVVLPAAVCVRAGRWLSNEGHVKAPVDVWHAALAIACPYALFTAAVALASRTQVAAPSLWEAVINGFGIAFVAGGYGAARTLAPWRRLAGLLPPRARSVTLGAAAGLALLIVAAGLAAAISLGVHLDSYQRAEAALRPGIFGSALLLVAELAYLPNAVIWSVAYILGPGFTFGAGTGVSPNGSALGALPALPMLAGLPAGPGAAFPAWLGFFVLLVPYLAGALAGLVTVRVTPTPFLEAAPLWGLATGTVIAVVIGVLAKFAGGPLGDGRLGSVGPKAAESGVVALLEAGVTAAIMAGAVNWLILRRHARRLAAAGPPGEELDGPAGAPGGEPPAVIDEYDDDGGHRIYVDPWAGAREEPDLDSAGLD